MATLRHRSGGSKFTKKGGTAILQSFRKSLPSIPTLAGVSTGVSRMSSQGVTGLAATAAKGVGALTGKALGLTARVLVGKDNISYLTTFLSTQTFMDPLPKSLKFKEISDLCRAFALQCIDIPVTSVQNNSCKEDITLLLENVEKIRAFIEEKNEDVRGEAWIKFASGTTLLGMASTTLEHVRIEDISYLFKVELLSNRLDGDFNKLKSDIKKNIYKDVLYVAAKEAIKRGDSTFFTANFPPDVKHAAEAISPNANQEKISYMTAESEYEIALRNAKASTKDTTLIVELAAKKKILDTAATKPGAIAYKKQKASEAVNAEKESKKDNADLAAAKKLAGPTSRFSFRGGANAAPDPLKKFNDIFGKGVIASKAAAKAQEESKITQNKTAATATINEKIGIITEVINNLKTEKETPEVKAFLNTGTPRKDFVDKAIDLMPLHLESAKAYLDLVTNPNVDKEKLANDEAIAIALAENEMNKLIEKMGNKSAEPTASSAAATASSAASATASSAAAATAAGSSATTDSVASGSVNPNGKPVVRPSVPDTAPFKPSQMIEVFGPRMFTLLKIDGLKKLEEEFNKKYENDVIKKSYPAIRLLIDKPNSTEEELHDKLPKLDIPVTKPAEKPKAEEPKAECKNPLQEASKTLVQRFDKSKSKSQIPWTNKTGKRFIITRERLQTMKIRYCIEPDEDVPKDEEKTPTPNDKIVQAKAELEKLKSQQDALMDLIKAGPIKKPEIDAKIAEMEASINKLEASRNALAGITLSETDKDLIVSIEKQMENAKKTITMAKDPDKAVALKEGRNAVVNELKDKLTPINPN